jgi:protoporphyrinogen/coproporphyrinogen III oxidase
VAARRRAVVVGGGVAGLTWALDAADADCDVVVLERDATLGGVVRSAPLGPVTVDVGAESFALTRPDVLELAARLGLTDDVVRPAVGQAHVLLGGRRFALPPGLLGIPGEADDIAALLGADAAALARRLDAEPVGEEAPATIGALVRERLGDAVADVLVDPVLAGVHATRADDAELASVAPALHAAMRAHGGLMPAVRALRGALGPAGSPVASFDGGMGRLVERLAATLDARGVQVRLGTAATALRHDGTWHVRCTVADGSEDLDADVLCLAVPARTASALLATVASPDAPGPEREAEAEGMEARATEAAGVRAGARTIARALEGLPTTHDVTLVTLLLEDAVLARAGAPVGSGVLVADAVADAGADGTVRAKAMTHASAKWGWLADRLPADHHVVRLSYGGTHEHGRPASDADLVTIAHEDALRLFAGTAGHAALRGALVTRWQGALSRPVVGRAARLAAIDASLASLPHLALTGSAVAGNGLAGVVGRSAREATRTLH